MEKAVVDDRSPDRSRDGVDVHALSDRLETSDVALNHYRVPPGEGLPAGLHAHLDQEEVFVVLSGTATFEVLTPGGVDAEGRELHLADPSHGPEGRVSGEVTVEAGEAVRFAPGEFQSGHNHGGEDMVVLALGAPRDSEEVLIPVECPACGRASVRLETGAAGITFACPDCGTERVPQDCPDCGAPGLEVTLADDGGTAVGCTACGAEFDSAPLEDPP